MNSNKIVIICNKFVSCMNTVSHVEISTKLHNIVVKAKIVRNSRDISTKRVKVLDY